MGILKTYEMPEVNLDRLNQSIIDADIISEFSGLTYEEQILSVLGDTLNDEPALDALIAGHDPTPTVSYPDITPRQIRLALLFQGITDADVRGGLDTLPEPQKSAAIIEWEYSTVYVRDNALVSSVATMLGWTSQQLDDLWIYAYTL